MIGRVNIFSIVALAMAATPLTMGSPKADADVWKQSKLQVIDRKLAHELDGDKTASETLGEYGNHHVELARREATGGAEMHETQNDVFFILSGEATLVRSEERRV